MRVVRWIAERVVVLVIPIGMRLRFDPAAAHDLDTVLELRVAETGSRFAVRVADGRCRVERRAAPEASAQVAISAGDIARLTIGDASWPALLAGRRLELTGDPFLALRFPKLFGYRA